MPSYHLLLAFLDLQHLRDSSLSSSSRSGSRGALGCRVKIFRQRPVTVDFVPISRVGTNSLFCLLRAPCFVARKLRSFGFAERLLFLLARSSHSFAPGILRTISRPILTGLSRTALCCFSTKVFRVHSLPSSSILKAWPQLEHFILLGETFGYVKYDVLYT